MTRPVPLDRGYDAVLKNKLRGEGCILKDGAAKDKRGERCGKSSRKNYEERSKKKKVVGTAGFEPATTTPPV